jgi:hypothetical protein
VKGRTSSKGLAYAKNTGALGTNAKPAGIASRLSREGHPDNVDHTLYLGTVDFTQKIDALVSGYYHACGLSQQQVYCWGNQGNGKNPKLVDVPEKVTAVTSGPDFVCSLDENGQVKCWGNMIHITASQDNDSPPVLMDGLPSNIK